MVGAFVVKVAVVYESIFGNTRDVARAIAEGLGGDVTLVEVGEALPGLVRDVDLLVLGGPTHVWSMSGRMSRNGARKQARHQVVSQGIGVREWLKQLPTAPGLRVAAFDTGIRQTGWFPTGSAAAPIATHLRRKQAKLIAAPERFAVVATEGPMAEGELSRAKRWGADLAQKMARGGAEVAFAEPVGHRGLNRGLGIFMALVGLSAVAGGTALLSDVQGGNMGFSVDDLDDTPFDDYLIPGLLLLIAVGGSQLLGGFALLRGWRRGPELAIVAGAVLAGWIAVQMTMIQFHFLQPLFLAIGLAIMLAGWTARVLRGT